MAALLIVMAGLKLTDEVAWSWWVITAPIWLIPALQFVYGFVIEFPKAYMMHYRQARLLRELREKQKRVR
jgi:hypothetical protein